MNKAQLGEALRTLRKASGKEAKAVARSALMSPSKLSKIENARLSPSTADVERILSALGAKACGGNTHPSGESCVTLAPIGEDAWAMGDSKPPGMEPLRFTTAELAAAGIDPASFRFPV